MFRSTFLRRAPGVAGLIALVALLAPAGAQAQGCANVNLKPTRANRRRRHCTRYVAIRGSFTHRGRAGANSLRFTGRVSGRKLRLGRHRLVATPLAADGRRGTSIRKLFRIIP